MMKKLLPLAEAPPMERRAERPPPFGSVPERARGQLRLVNGTGVPEDPRDIEYGEIARHYLRARRQREARLSAQLFADPVWDTMLHLFAARTEGKAITVTDACAAACVPPTTALRWFTKMEETGLLNRRLDPRDARRAYLELTPDAMDEIRSWLQHTFLNGPHLR
ncbi:hypothetical protein [Sphingosinicella sp. BN140058]|uniref:hypothetical protein n=1 Tax=Sphingosinicella sp. BN140058 TaxID=1892855 RepID=UPI0010112F70|nr:hypothetical protein [Sphingosinicella sp. BN140058]QAY79046.1 hypothetical protein ETR14_22775 [Sphingosinicella sp. BN140058]